MDEGDGLFMGHGGPRRTRARRCEKGTTLPPRVRASATQNGGWPGQKMAGQGQEAYSLRFKGYEGTEDRPVGAP